MIPEETPAVQNITPVETPAVPETPAAPVDEQQYEYVEVPADQVPADAQQYEYDEVPADQAVQDFGVEKLDELEETPTVENVTPAPATTVENITPAETVAEPETVAPSAETYDFASLEMPETAAPVAPEVAVEDITPVETIPEPDVAAPTAPAAVENITPVETVAEPETVAPPAAVAVPAAPAAAQIAEETQEELDPPEISDTLSAPAPDVEAAAMQVTADMTQQAETAQEILAGETAEIENVPPAETVTEPETIAEPDVAVPVEAITEPETVASPAAAEVAVPAASVAPDAPDAPAAPEGFVFKDGDGQKSFTAESAAQSVTIDTADLSRWMIVLNQISVSPVEAAAGQQIELSPDMYCQGQLIGATGDVMPFANMANVPVPEFSPDPVQSATLFFSGVSIIPLANQGGVTMDLGGANGVVVNTNGDMLYFANLSALTLIETPAPVAETTAPATTNASVAPDAPPATVAVPAAPAATIPAYAFAPVPAPLNDAVVFSADSESAQVDGNDGKPHILVKANDRLLGWHVDFAAAGRMSLADVKAYQAAHGDLPEHDGVLTFKDKSLTFKNILSIRVFETPAYCGYGIAPAV